MTNFKRGIEWSDAETALLIERLGEGVAHPAIAAELNVAFHAGEPVRIKGSISGKVQSLRERGKLPAFTGIVTNHHGLAWSDAETAALVRRRRFGESFEAIAAALNAEFHGGREIRTRPQCAGRARTVGCDLSPEQARAIRLEAARSKGGARSPWRDDEIALLLKFGATMSAQRLAAQVNRRCHGGASKRSKGEVEAQVMHLRRDGRLTARPPAGQYAGSNASTVAPRSPGARPQSNPAPAGHPVVPSETGAGSHADPAPFFPVLTRRIEAAALIGPARECRWIEGEKPYFAGGDPYCGAASVAGSSYCAAHRARVYRPVSADLIREAANVA